MTPRLTRLALAAALLAAPGLAQDGAISVEDAYAVAVSPGAKGAAAYMVLVNGGETGDRLLGAASEAAGRVELHSQSTGEDGVTRMVRIEDGVPIPPGGTVALEPGGDHVMFMGLGEPFTEGGTVTVTLTFETAGDLAIEIPTRIGAAHGG